MKKKITLIACLLSVFASFSLTAQTQTSTQPEIPSWIIKQAKEHVAKFKNELKLTAADSTVFTDEFAKRLARTSAGCKIATTPEGRLEASNVSTREYFETLKKKISPALYRKYVDFLNRPKTN